MVKVKNINFFKRPIARRGIFEKIVGGGGG